MVLGFDKPEFRGEIIEELDRLRDGDTVRLKGVHVLSEAPPSRNRNHRWQPGSSSLRLLGVIDAAPHGAVTIVAVRRHDAIGVSPRLECGELPAQRGAGPSSSTPSGPVGSDEAGPTCPRNLMRVFARLNRLTSARQLPRRAGISPCGSQVRPARFERATGCLEGSCSIR
jgi:hypothetical protein